MKKIVIIDYKAGNVANVQNAISLAISRLLPLMSEGNRERFEIYISQNPNEVNSADILIFPGVGSAGTAMKNLKRLDLINVIKDKAKSETPFLGICLGMQILFDYSEEQNTECLGILKGTVNKLCYQSANTSFDVRNQKLKVPQIGWNNVTQSKYDPIWDGIKDREYFYHVHSYYPSPEDDIGIGETEYGSRFTSAIRKGNIVATQFHPEKSGEVGIILLNNFLLQSCNDTNI